MTGPDTTDAAREWQALQADWEAAAAAHKQAVEAAGGAGHETPETVAALKKLADIKAKMNRLIAAGRAARAGRRPEDLTVTVIDLKGGGEGDPEDR